MTNAFGAANKCDQWSKEIRDKVNPSKPRRLLFLSLDFIKFEQKKRKQVLFGKSKAFFNFLSSGSRITSADTFPEMQFVSNAQSVCVLELVLICPLKRRIKRNKTFHIPFREQPKTKAKEWMKITKIPTMFVFWSWLVIICPLWSGEALKLMYRRRRKKLQLAKRRAKQKNQMEKSSLKIIMKQKYNLKSVCLLNHFQNQKLCYSNNVLYNIGYHGSGIPLNQRMLNQLPQENLNIEISKNIYFFQIH